MVQRNRLFLLFTACAVSMIVFVLVLSDGTPVVRAGRVSAPRVATPTIDRNMNAKYVDNLQAAQTPVANKLLPLDASGKFPLAVIPQGAGSGLDADRVDGLNATALQKRVTGTCAAGNAISSIGANGTVGCQATGGLTLPFNGSGVDSDPLLQITNTKGDAVSGASPDQFGVSGYTKTGTGVYGDNGNSDTTGHAGFFNGRVHVTKGLVVDGNLSAKNVPGVTFSDDSTNHDIQNQTKDVGFLTVAVPATGYLLITSSVRIRATSGTFTLKYGLFDSTNETEFLAIAYEEDHAGPSDYLLRTMQLSTVVPVTAGSYTFHTTLEEFANQPGQRWFYDNLIAMYFPVEY